MLTVGKDVSAVEADLVSGALSCPPCGGRLRPWGYARERCLRAAGGARWPCAPRRARCADCAVTHVLLPVTALLRRADVVEVIGSGLVAAAAGAGYRKVAARLGRPPETVRGWIRRARVHARAWRAGFTALFVDLGGEVLPAPTDTPLGDALAALAAAAVTVRGRWPAVLSGCSMWELGCAACHGGLLSPVWPGLAANTSRPW